MSAQRQATIGRRWGQIKPSQWGQFRSSFPICNSALLADEDRPQTPSQWETWLATPRKTIDVVWEPGTADAAEPRLIHLHCNTTRQPSGLA